MGAAAGWSWENLICGVVVIWSTAWTHTHTAVDPLSNKALAHSLSWWIKTIVFHLRLSHYGMRQYQLSGCNRQNHLWLIYNQKFRAGLVRHFRKWKLIFIWCALTFHGNLILLNLSQPDSARRSAAAIIANLIMQIPDPKLFSPESCASFWLNLLQCVDLKSRTVRASFHLSSIYNTFIK